jgi:putative redox protein
MADDKGAVIATIGMDAFRTRLDMGIHVLYADEPVDAGGQDAGPAPHDFLKMGLASCTAITLRMYADRKAWPVEQIRVRVYLEKTEEKTIFHRAIELQGNLDEAQRKRLLQIANACPVHKTLTQPIEVSTLLIKEVNDPSQTG